MVQPGIITAPPGCAAAEEVFIDPASAATICDFRP